MNGLAIFGLTTLAAGTTTVGVNKGCGGMLGSKAGPEAVLCFVFWAGILAAEAVVFSYNGTWF